MPVVLPTLKYATQKHYRYMLDAHLIPAFGPRQLRELTREELQSFLSREFEGGLAWETIPIGTETAGIFAAIRPAVVATPGAAIRWFFCKLRYTRGTRKGLTQQLIYLQ